MTRLGLGTAQFGMAYGVSNAEGQVGLDEMRRILGRAREAGVTLLDTAPSYGDAEARLGQCIGDPSGLRIVTKTQPLRDREPGPAIEQDLLDSLRRLGQSQIHGLLVHEPASLTGPKGRPLIAALEAVKARGLVERVGVSVYDAAELDAILARFTPDIVQLPLNALDQRLARSGHLSRLKRLGSEVHGRSVFLQGLLLMDPQALPAGFEGHRARLAEYREAARAAGVSPLQAALGAVSSFTEIDHVLVGVCSLAQLEEIAAAVRAPPAALDLERFACHDTELLDPRRWPSGARGR